MNKYLAITVTILGAITAATATLPYQWARIIAAAAGAANGVLAGGAGVATVATQRALKTPVQQPRFWEGTR